MDRWTELQAFARVAVARSMTRAAAEMNLSVPGVSRHLMKLETRVATRIVRSDHVCRNRSRTQMLCQGRREFHRRL